MAQKYKLTEEQRKLLSRKNIRLEKKDQKQYDEWLYLQMLACAKRYFDPKLDNYDKSIPMEYRVLFTILERGLTQEYTDENGDTKMRFLWKTLRIMTQHWWKRRSFYPILIIGLPVTAFVPRFSQSTKKNS